MEIVAGGIAAVAILGLGYATRRSRSLSFYSDVLIVIALAYVLFAVMDGASRTIIVESAIAAGFIAVAVVGAQRANLRAAGLLVAGGLAAHGVYDLVHSAVVPNPVVPSWWPLFCGVVDVLLAGWVVRLGLWHRAPGRGDE
jgi:hypothetical protein